MITFTVTLQHKRSFSHAWVKRRFGKMMNDIMFAHMTALIGKADFSPLHKTTMFAEMPDYETYILRVEIHSDDMKDFYAIKNYLSKSKKNYTVLLDKVEPSLIMEAPCESHPDTSPTSPPPVTSATC